MSMLFLLARCLYGFLTAVLTCCRVYHIIYYHVPGTSWYVRMYTRTYLVHVVFLVLVLPRYSPTISMSFSPCDTSYYPGTPVHPRYTLPPSPGVSPTSDDPPVLRLALPVPPQLAQHEGARIRCRGYRRPPRGHRAHGGPCESAAAGRGRPTGGGRGVRI